MIDANFRQRFEDPHRKLKASIHRCQANAYSKQGLSLDDSEQMARACFLPLLLVRRHAQTMLLNARDDYKVCMTDAEEKIGQRGYDTARMGCLNGYKADMKKQVPSLNQIYEGYQRNFQAHDGSLINVQFQKLRGASKEDGKYLGDISE